MKFFRRIKVRLGGFRIGRRNYLRLGSLTSILGISLLVASTLLGEWLGTPDAWWLKTMDWIGIAVILEDIIYCLSMLTPRKRWESVTLIGIFGGLGSTICALILYLEADTDWKATLILGAVTLTIGLIGWPMWRRELKKLDCAILDRKRRRKK